MKTLILTLTCVIALSQAVTAAELTAEEQKGKVIYDKRCIGCHGETGKGDGPAADRLRPRPRSFKVARYKFTFTEFGKLPQDSTLVRWVTEGLPGSSMPAWKDILNEDEIKSVVSYIKTLSRKFARAKKKGRTPKPISVGAPPKWTEADIKAGRELFLKNCAKCHGDEGRGSGPSAIALKHDLGDRIWPRNLTKGWMYRAGNKPEDIFRTLATGITGTPMPSHISLDPEEKGAVTIDEAWKVVGFVDSIVVRGRPNTKEVIFSKFVEGDLPKDSKDERWSALTPGYLPLVSQIIEGDRWFKTTLESVYVRSMYNDKDIVILVEWDDRSNSPLDKANEKFPENEPDAMAIQLPTVIPTGMEKPYFLGGNADTPVVLWKWTNGKGAEVLSSKGILKQEKMSDENQVLSVSTSYKAGRWSALFKRSLKGSTEDDLTFEPGKYLPIAFNGWDGSNGEKNEQRAISIWYWILLEPPKTMTVYLFPAFIGLLIAAGEVALIKKAKNKDRRRD